MKAVTILNATDMGQARAPLDFLGWVERKRIQLNVTADAKAYAQSGDSLAKKFYDEILPLAQFIAHEYSNRNDVLVRPNLNNDNFDAHVTLGTGHKRQDVFLEITYAKDGYDLSLRMEVLAREGDVFLTGQVTSTGRKGALDRHVHVEPDASDHHKMLEQYFTLIEKRLRDKSGVCYGNSHTLLVAVDDYFALLQESDWSRLSAFADTLLPTLALDFTRVVFVGMAGKLFLPYYIVRHTK